ncbi:MAG: hypothetical protein FWG44_01570 [Oscillospiraceae bacterium]|nr:hypothetical protein [Oscillospiraceae bacterium]
MDIDTIKQKAKTFTVSRANLLIVVVMTAVNIVLVAVEADFSFLFSASMPLVIYGFFIGLDFAVAGMLLALVAVGLYALFWALAKNMRGFIVAALILFSIDTLVFVYLLIRLTAFEASFIINIAFHGWILFYLINGTAAWAALRNVRPDVMQQVFAEIAAEKGNKKKPANQQFQQQPWQNNLPQNQQHQQWQQQQMQQMNQQQIQQQQQWQNQQQTQQQLQQQQFPQQTPPPQFPPNQ